MRFKLAVLALLFATFNHPFTTAFAQGGLTPPGAPAPTMKSLAQIEPRTPISSVPFVISQPGSYYLTTNVTATTSNAITITASGVTLDLNGFTIASSVASAANGGTAIQLSGGLRNITIKDGFIQGGVTNNGSGVFSGSGFGNGIRFYNTSPANVLISRVAVSGCLFSGIYLNNGDGTVVESCTVRTAGSYGIMASTIKTSSAIDCGTYAIFGDQISDCRGQSDGFGYAIYAVTVQNSYGYNHGDGHGIYATTALNCYGVTNGDTGTTGAGIYTGSAQNCTGYNLSVGYGIYASRIAIGCYGYCPSGIGVNAFIANVCTGTSISSPHNINSF